jgi:hypothetical protein
MIAHHTISAFWHKESFERLMQERLPQLLASRLPLTGYHFEVTTQHTCRVTVAIAPTAGGYEVEVGYTNIPWPDEEGIFEIEGRQWVVMPIALQDELDMAEIRCVGEMLYDYIEPQLGEAPSQVSWDETLLRAWLPLEEWILAGLRQTPTYQQLDQTNWLSRCCHLRRLYLPDRHKLLTPGHFGRVCPFETPEGSNMARILSLAIGAEIRNGKLVVVDERPEAALGLTAAMIPLLEHDDPFHLLMGANMLRQWLPAPNPEPALVQSGNEPNSPDFWCGRNLLTAYICWSEDTFEEGIVLSESGAKQLDYPYPVEAGDKLSNRHGIKGVVSRILPDEQMPHLADGTPVELIFHSSGLHTRMNFGQLREALLGRIARIEGMPVVISPFQAPGESELRQRLVKAGLPEDGLERLRSGRDGQPFTQPNVVGWVYWGRLVHTAQSKIQASVEVLEDAQWQGEDEYQLLRNLGAFELLREQFHTRAAERTGAKGLAGQLVVGAVEQAEPPAEKFHSLSRRLAAAGIRMTFEADRLTFKFGPAEGSKILTLACSMPHPWLGERMLTEIGMLEAQPEYETLTEANTRLARMLNSQAPKSLTEPALTRLQERVQSFFDLLLTPEDVRFGSQVLFSGQAVLAPGTGLRLDQVGLAEEIAWTLFAPLVTRKLGDKGAVQKRTVQASQILDQIMADSWILLNRRPTSTPTALLAFKPVRFPDRVIRLHPLVCPLLDADFDGDQATVFLPITETAQREVGEHLSLAGHLRRDPALLKTLAPYHEAMWGLAYLSLTGAGQDEIKQLAGIDIPAPDGFITRPGLIEALARVLADQGIAATLTALERLAARGLEVAKQSGASMSPFIGAKLETPPEPDSDDPALWNSYAEQFAEQLAARTDFETDLGAQLLAIKSGARGQVNSLAMLLGTQGVVTDVAGQPVVIRHGYRDGLTPRELYALVASSREWMETFWRHYEQLDRRWPDSSAPKSFNVLARARRAQHPGIVFARAAAILEYDPLLDIDSRLFVGLPPKP